MYEVYIEQSAERDLEALSRENLLRIVPHLKALRSNPRPKGSKKLSGSKNDWRIRIGSFRVLYEVDDKEKVVRIMRVRHRREAYR